MANKHNNKKLNEHVHNEFKVQGQEGEWVGQEITTQSDNMLDQGVGRKIIIRSFQYSLPSTILPGQVIPSKKDILNFHKGRILAFLMKDELRLCEDISPDKAIKIVFDKKDKLKFTIFATCEARKGSLIFKDPNLLQHAIGRQQAK